MTIKTLSADLEPSPWPLHERVGAGGDRLLATSMGAQVLAWRSADGVDRLYRSRAAGREPDAPIRAGIPICWPQFDRLGPLPQHGWVRTAPWTLMPHVAGENPGSLRFELLASALTLRGDWLGTDFRLEVSHELGDRSLRSRLEVANTGPLSFAFTAALHGYFALDAAHAQRIGFASPAPSVGPEALDFEPGQRLWQNLCAPTAWLGGEGRQEHLLLQQEGFDTWVIWNPGSDGARRLPDLAPDECRGFVCIEATKTSAVVLKPGQVWRGQQLASIEQGGPGLLTSGTT